MTRAVCAGLCTRRGPGKEHNEDAVGFAGLVLQAPANPPLTIRLEEPGPAVAIVCDGMGGHAAGHVASAQSVALLMEHPRLTDGPQGARRAIEDAHRSLYDDLARDASARGMGATVVGVVVPPEGDAVVFNVGDSPLFLRDPDLGAVQHSVDHVVREDGAPTSRLTQSLGGTTELVRIDPHVRAVAVDAGDRIVLCSDGLMRTMTIDELGELIAGDSSPGAVAARLVRVAAERDATDDVSVVVLDVVETPAADG